MKNLFTSVLIGFIVLNSCQNKSNLSIDTSLPTHNAVINGQIIDLSHDYSKETVYWVTAKEFELDVVFKGETEKGFYYSANNFTTAEHGGTHIDAPIHFSANGQSVDEIALEKLIGNAIKIDVSAKALNNPDYQISIEDLKNWEEKENTNIPDKSIVLLQTGYSKYYSNKLKYLGTLERGEKALKNLHFPGLSGEAAQWLIENRNIHAIGIDTPSIDYGQSQYFESHVALLGKNIPAFENLTNLDQLPGKDFNIIALPMKIKKGSGAPLRIIALINK